MLLDSFRTQFVSLSAVMVIVLNVQRLGGIGLLYHTLLVSCSHVPDTWFKNQFIIIIIAGFLDLDIASSRNHIHSLVVVFDLRASLSAKDIRKQILCSS